MLRRISEVVVFIAVTVVVAVELTRTAAR